MSLVISAFPGTGKSTFFNKLPILKSGLDCLDSDSSKFSWSGPGVRHPGFPQNYIDHIKSNLNSTDVIMVSSHKVVRDALVKAGIEFVLVYPSKDLKQDYLDRYEARGNDSGFLKLMTDKFEDFVQECLDQVNCIHAELTKPTEFVEDVVLAMLRGYPVSIESTETGSNGDGIEVADVQFQYLPRAKR
jgi:hypothetical protein